MDRSGDHGCELIEQSFLPCYFRRKPEAVKKDFPGGVAGAQMQQRHIVKILGLFDFIYICHHGRCHSHQIFWAKFCQRTINPLLAAKMNCNINTFSRHVERFGPIVQSDLDFWVLGAETRQARDKPV